MAFVGALRLVRDTSNRQENIYCLQLSGWLLRSATGAIDYRSNSNRGPIEANVPADLDIHIVMDNYGTHKTKAIRDWFAKRPRWQAHFTPTSASWLNQVERWFGLLTDKQIRRGVHRSTKELERTILDYIDTTNQNPKPFKWTKSADDILAAIQRFCLRTIETAEQQAKIMRTSESGH